MEEHEKSTPENSVSESETSTNSESSNDSGFPTMDSPTKSDDSEENATITLKKSTVWKMAAFVFAGLFIVSLFGGFGDGGGGIEPPTGDVIAPGNVRITIADDDPVLGDEDAPISIVEFSDFQCPFCARAASGAVADFKNSDYFKNGEVNLVFKQFPLNSIHPQAQKAAEASECAHDQGKFWEYHDLLFLNQQALDIVSLKAYALQLGLDQATFDSCLDSGAKTESVNADTAAAAAAGGRGTPYFVIVNEDGDTQAVSGAVPWANFEAAITSLQ